LDNRILVIEVSSNIGNWLEISIPFEVEIHGMLTIYNLKGNHLFHGKLTEIYNKIDVSEWRGCDIKVKVETRHQTLLTNIQLANN
jgi:hypothetical protein